ncbi:site-specific DNA-methyltransferase [Heliobacterium chlorum]|uniref:Site-specific DNA-methyltransferase n=1 Tax=Heliobacterium chlorum TaxID=2698 RepID=A0ABR7T5I2_HELCL|nr:DNA methyltransferase [Heliobacterium chlorum]MBC9785094.1 site-specific DNA-methyltransferase [Heliobacterium chlorum]
MELNTVHHFDCIEGMHQLPDMSIDLAVVDPPYGINFRSSNRKKYPLKSSDGILNDELDNADFLESVIVEINRVLKTNSHIYWFTRWDKVKIQQPLLEKFFQVKNSLIWMKMVGRWVISEEPTPDNMKTFCFARKAAGT